MHVFTWTYTHTHMHISYMHTHMHSAYIHIHTHMCTHAYMHINIYIYRYARTHMHIQACTCTRAYIHACNAQSHTHTHWSSVAGKTQFTSNCISVTFEHFVAQGAVPFSILSTLRALWRSRPQYSQQIPDSLSRTIKLPAAPPVSSLSWPQFLISITLLVIFQDSHKAQKEHQLERLQSRTVPGSALLLPHCTHPQRKGNGAELEITPSAPDSELQLQGKMEEMRHGSDCTAICIGFPLHKVQWVRD